LWVYQQSWLLFAVWFRVRSNVFDFIYWLELWSKIAIMLLMTLSKLIDYRNQHPQLWLPRNRAEFEHREVTTYEPLLSSGFIDQLKTKSDISVILRTGGTSSLAFKILPSSPHRFKYNDRMVSQALLFDVIRHQWPIFVLQLLRYKVAFLPGDMFELGKVPTRYVSNALVSEKWWLWEWVCPVPQEVFDGVGLFETSEEKLSAIAQYYDGRSPAVISWVPWVVLQFAQERERLYNQPLRPQVVIVWWCAIEPYVQQIRQALWEGVLIIPYYNATEGTFGYQPRELRDNHDYQTLALKHYCGVWYELVNDKGEIINLSEAKLGVSYRLLISTYDGLCRYELGDVIEMVDVAQWWIRIMGRTSEYIDIANEHTQIQHVQQTMSQLGGYYNPWHYCVFPSQKGGVWHYVLVVESKPPLTPPSQEGNLAQKFDEILWTQNCNYAAKRNGGTLWPVQVRVVEQWWFEDLIAQLNHERQSTQSKLLTLYPREDNPVSKKLFS
jgi:GH3 auxin-responsive promoter